MDGKSSFEGKLAMFHMVEEQQFVMMVWYMWYIILKNKVVSNHNLLF